MFTVYVYEPVMYRDFVFDLYFRHGNIVYRFNSDGEMVSNYFHSILIDNPALAEAVL